MGPKNSKDGSRSNHKASRTLQDHLVSKSKKVNIKKDYHVENEIGKGQSASTSILQVKSKKYIKSERGSYALKLYDGKAEIPPDLIKEAEILKACDHPNIVKLYEMGKSGKKISLMLELCSGGTLQDRLPYTEAQASKITRQVLSAVAYLHRNNIIHRDVNFTNILFESNDAKNAHVKLIDFGVATYIERDEKGTKYFSKKTGTVETMAPEVIKCKYSAKADVWSVGVVTYMLLMNGKKPFEGKTVEQLEERILNGYVPYYDWKTSKQSKAFVKQLLVANPHNRLSAAQALQQEFIFQSAPPVMLSNSLVASLQLYLSSSPLKRAALNVLARKVPVNPQYRQVFCDLDITQSGTLTRDEFVKGFQKTGFSQEELEELFVKLDINENGEVLFTEFMAATLEATGHEPSKGQLRDAFDLLDEDSSGYISKKNLLKILGNTPAIRRMLDGHVQMDFEEFCGLFEHRVDRKMDAIAEAEDMEEHE